MTDALLAHLPPAGWGEVATVSSVEQSLDMLGNRIRAEIADLRAEFQREIRLAITQQTRTLQWSMVGAFLTVAVMAFSAARLI